MLNQTPEQIARDAFDKQLTAWRWLIQNKTGINLSARVGNALREYGADLGPADYVLFADKKLVVIIEAKRAGKGTRLTIHEHLSEGYAAAKLKYIVQLQKPPFVYESTGEVTRFTDYRDTYPSSSLVSTFHYTETITEWGKGDKLLWTKIHDIPCLPTAGLWNYQVTTTDLFCQQYNTAEDIKANKNTIFSSIFMQNNFGFRASNSDITSKLVHTSGDMYYFRVAVKRNTRRYKKDFSEEVIENYPNLLVAINNNPQVQKIAIQTNTIAFDKTIIVARFIKETVEKFLKDYNISFSVEPTFDKQQFWNIVRQYPKQIKQVTFDLISPNITNLSDDLQLDLRGLHGDTNTQKTRLELNADQDSYLTINEESPLVNSIVNYSAKGGGEIAVKVEGIKRKLHTAQSVNDFNIEEQLLKANDWDALDKAFKNILI